MLFTFKDLFQVKLFNRFSVESAEDVGDNFRGAEHDGVGVGRGHGEHPTSAR